MRTFGVRTGEVFVVICVEIKILCRVRLFTARRASTARYHGARAPDTPLDFHRLLGAERRGQDDDHVGRHVAVELTSGDAAISELGALALRATSGNI